MREFSIKAAFKIFDKQQKGFLSINDFKDAVKDISVQDRQQIDDIYLIFRRYDRDNDGFLSLQEFSHLLVP